MKAKTRRCVNHPEVEAAYRCSQCCTLLCLSCVKQDKHLFFCRACGSHALLLETPSKPIGIEEAAAQVSEELRGLSLPVIDHIVLPAAVILMVSAFLFFLLDVRSVFFRESLAIRRVAFCFGAATVLIARYGRSYGEKGRQMLYTLALSFATVLVMMKYSHGLQDFLASVLVVAAVWWLATHITDCLDIGDDEEPEKQRVFGVERIAREEVIRKIRAKRGLPIPIASQNHKIGMGRAEQRHLLEGPASVVAKLAALALIAFALGEPALLSGEPEAGKRAIMAVIVFLFATGIVMSAGSALAVSRRVRLAGGRFSFRVISSKMGMAFLLLAVILSATLAVPGIKYKGSGEMIPKISKVNTERQAKKMSENRNASQRGRQRNPVNSGNLFRFVASLGQLLLIPLILLLVGLFVYILLKLKPQQKLLLSIRDLFRRIWAKLRYASRLRSREKESSGTLTRNDIVKKLTTLHNLPPRQTILKAYEGLGLFFCLLGHHRPPNNTPYEVLISLPRRYEFLKDHAARLTDLYVNAAYSRSPVTAQEAQSAKDEIWRIDRLIEDFQKNLK